MNPRYTFESKRAQLRIARLLALLEGRMLPSAKLAELLHCDQSLVADYLSHLRAAPRRVRVAGHEVINGSKRALYGIGDAPDEPMTRLSNKERYAQVATNPEKHERCLTLARNLLRRKRAAETRKRDRRIYDPPLEIQIVDLLNRMPGCTNEQIAGRLQANQRAVQRVMQRLSKAGTIQRAKASTMKQFQWEVPDRPMTATPRVKAQPWFAALPGAQLVKINKEAA